ncbi:MAG TPA: GNAT family N-acetyltransferase [Defluviitaleaceae bacterium]|jgi:GNAT superfamily N-acetyltransferase|nr:GNAT family N-acetyltransferase [Defluviitaleaceae bacterium]HQD50978.1 GNAT family N-acetyltransferase [Defluviitaleaceae bacterium]
MIHYKKLNLSDLKEARELVWNVFLEFVAPDYSTEGVENFKKFIDENNLKDNVNTGNMEFYGAFTEGRIVGVIAVRGCNHICLFFVDKEFHGQGIARNLFELVKKNLSVGDKVEKVITVNASPYAVKIYEKLAFNVVDNEQEKDGIRFTPMKYVF